MAKELTIEQQLENALKELEGLKAANAKLIDENSGLKKDAEELKGVKAELDTANTLLETAKADNAKLVEALELAKGEKEALDGIVEELQKDNAEGETVVMDSDVIVKDGKNQYKVLAKKLKHKGVEYSAEELKENADVVKDLVKIKSGVLQKLKGE